MAPAAARPRSVSSPISERRSSTEMDQHAGDPDPAVYARDPGGKDSPDLALRKEADAGIRTQDPRFTRVIWGRERRAFEGRWGQETPCNRELSVLTGLVVANPRVAQLMYAFCTRVRCAEGRQRSRACGEDAPAKALLETLMGQPRTQAPPTDGVPRVEPAPPRHIASGSGSAALGGDGNNNTSTASRTDSRARAAAPLQRPPATTTPPPPAATSTGCSPTADDGARPPSARARTARVEGGSRSHRTWSRRSRSGRRRGSFKTAKPMRRPAKCRAASCSSSSGCSLQLV
jgi:hypothetical protein